MKNSVVIILLLIAIGGIWNAIDIGKYEKACNNGNMKKCHQLGQIYKEGSRVIKNYSTAQEYYRKSCNSHYYSSCLSLGHMYRNGKGVEKNYLEAVKYYRTSCIDYGSDLGCSVLGDLYTKGGFGIKKDYLKAKSFYTIACDGTVARGCYSLALLYEEGNGVLKNIVKAKEYYKKGCDGFVSPSCKKYSELN